jgi:hypothetical protein
MAAPAEHPFLTARHVDDLTDAVRKLTHEMGETRRQHQQGLDIERRMLEVMRGISESVDALREVIVRQKTNGNAAHAPAPEGDVTQ